jgi:hypothetical protein
LRFAVARASLLALAAIAVFAVAAISFQAPASAQERRGFGWSLRDLLFPQRQERYELLGPVEKPQRKRKKAVPDTPVAPPAPVVEKAPDARVVLVVGDFMASGLAEGLEDVFADNPGIVVVNRTNGSSGFVRDDFYDWPAEIDGILKEEKPAAIVVMLGSNDRQPMKIGDASEALRSDSWTREYKARTKKFGEALAADKAPFLWVGQPAFKIAKMTSDMLAFDDIYRAAAEATGGEFVDIWDGFVDENGAFVSSGPDINGQLVRLRGDDGINLTRAGKRKIAFYAEKPLLKILGLATPDGAPAQPAPAGAPAVLNPDGTAIPVLVDRTPPMLLSDPALDGGVELLGAAPPAQAASSPDKDAIADDVALGGVAGRADDFSWPRRQLPAATAASDATTAIRP